ncbi:MAG TPA: DUF559 domain-containing protein [Capillimicrobium sp.]|jgi:very-short-patch-repair endonuclease
MFDVRRLVPAEREPDSTPRSAAARIAAAQHGVVAASQLVGEGMSTSAIGRAAESGWLVRKYRGVYAVGHDCLTLHGEWMAAVLAGGEGTSLSHRSSAAARSLRPDARSAIDITVPGRRGLAQPGLVAHRCKLHPDDVTTLDGIPITTVSRSLLDLAEVVPFHQLRRAVERAEELRLFDLNEMHATLARAVGRRGTKPLRRVLDDLVDRPTGTRLELEARALDLIRAHDLPTPAVNTLVGPYEVDLLWREQRLVVELDSWAHHRQRRSFETDRARDADLQAAGYRVARFTWQHVTQRPAWVADTLRSLLR